MKNILLGAGLVILGIGVWRHAQWGGHAPAGATLPGNAKITSISGVTSGASETDEIIEASITPSCSPCKSLQSYRDAPVMQIAPGRTTIQPVARYSPDSFFNYN